MQTGVAELQRAPFRSVDVSKVRHIRDIESMLVPATLKFFTQKAFGFVIPADGKDYFIHVANCRIIGKDGSLRRPAMDEITKASLGSAPTIRIIPGDGRDGRPAALLWIVSRTTS